MQNFQGLKAYRILLYFCFLFLAPTALAAETYCFVISDLHSDQALQKVGNCDVPSTPASSFKIPLAVMGLDHGVFKDATHPQWQYREEIKEEREVCRAAQTPASWLKNSCVWFSQDLTRKLGMKRFKKYVDQFNYGNRDVSGDPDANNGLTRSWLGSSLKIKPTEQITFLKKLLLGRLPVSQNAQSVTRELLFLEELAGGWKLYGKTGTGYAFNPDGTLNPERHLGWFVGWIQKGSQTRVFAYRSYDDQKYETAGGPRAREKLKLELKAQGYLKE